MNAIRVYTLALGLFLIVSRSGFGDQLKFTAGGELVRPEGYREWIYIGTPVTPNELNNGKASFPEFHSVYIDKESWEVWKKTGKFREGTMMVKELVDVGSKAATSGNGYFMGEFHSLEVSVKSKERFPNEPGNWAYFSFGEHKAGLKKSAKAYPTAQCASCHQGSAAYDMVYSQYYPVLRAAKGK